MNHGSVTIRILLADELDIVRDGLRALLSWHHAWEICAEATNGREAVEKALQFGPDVAVLDLGLAELNGLESARRIRKALPGTEVILLAPQTSEQLARDAYEAGARSLVLKSEAKRVLIPALESIVPQTPVLAGGTSEMSSGRASTSLPWAKTKRPRSHLTPREREIVQLVAEGRTSREIAAMLVRSIKTVEAHRANIMNKLGLQCVTELVRYAIRNKIVEG